MKIEIKSRWTGVVLFSVETTSWKLAVEAAVKARADLMDADLTRADLTPIRDDIWAVLSAAPGEVEGLRRALIEGRVDGSAYEGACACLVGTLANVRGVSISAIPTLHCNSSRPAERFFMGIKPGDTPQTNPVAKRALEWVDEWLAAMRAAFGPTSA